MSETPGFLNDYSPSPRATMQVFRPIALLRLEAACVFLGSLALYHHHHGSWVVFAVAFFAPDISIPAYAWSSSAGWRLYNLTHTYVAPAVLSSILLVTAPARVPLTLIWFAHIAWDRMLAFGLKQGEDFWDTHLGRITGARRLWEQLTAGKQ